MSLQRGIVTLTLLLLLSSTLLLLMLFDDDMLDLHSAIAYQRKQYLEQSISLQMQVAKQKVNACEQLNVESDLQVYQVSFERGEQQDRLSQYVLCERKSLFKQAPKKFLYEYGLEEWIDLKFRPHFKSLGLPPKTFPKNGNHHVYWFGKNENMWEISGNVNAVVIAEGDLTITGKGKISGTVITGGTFNKADDVQLTYRKATVTHVMQLLSYWQLAERSWYDFSPL